MYRASLGGSRRGECASAKYCQGCSRECSSRRCQSLTRDSDATAFLSIPPRLSLPHWFECPTGILALSCQGCAGIRDFERKDTSDRYPRRRRYEKRCPCDQLPTPRRIALERPIEKLPWSAAIRCWQTAAAYGEATSSRRSLVVVESIKILEYNTFMVYGVINLVLDRYMGYDSHSCRRKTCTKTCTKAPVPVQVQVDTSHSKHVHVGFEVHSKPNTMMVSRSLLFAYHCLYSSITVLPILRLRESSACLPRNRERSGRRT